MQLGEVWVYNWGKWKLRKGVQEYYLYFSPKVLEADRNDHDIVNYALETLVNVTGPEEYPEEAGETWFLLLQLYVFC